MFKHLPIKIFSLFLAAVFWVLVVSLENTFYQLPAEIPIQVFNQAADLALSSKLGFVRLAVRSPDIVTARTLSAGDFEAYVDLRNLGAGTRKVPVSVTSKNSRVSVLRVTPSEVAVTLEPIREKTVALKAEVKGQPLRGYRVDSVKLSRERITIIGADSLLKTIGQAKAQIVLDGTETTEITRDATVFIYDQTGAILDAVKRKAEEEVEVKVSIVESETAKAVGVRPIVTGGLADGVVKKISVNPAVVMVKGSKTLLDSLEAIPTEMVDLKDAAASFESRVKLILPQGITLAEGSKLEVKVSVEIGKE